MELRLSLILALCIFIHPALFSQNIKQVAFKEETFKGSTILKMSAEEKLAFKDRILEVVTELTDKISTIGDKSAEREYRMSAMDEAFKLFISDTCAVQVSNVYDQSIKELSIREYFEHLYALPYYNVEILFYEIAQVSELERGPNGYWVGTAFIYQLFKGYESESHLLYTDKTIKRVEIIVGENCKEIGDEEKCFPEVKLRNIRVSQTRPE